MTVVAAFALTVSVGLHWRVLSEAILPAGEHAARLSDNETHTAISDKAEGVSSSMQAGSPQLAEEPATPNNSPDLTRSSAKEVVDGSFAQPTTAGASAFGSLAFVVLGVSADTANATVLLLPSGEIKRP